MKFRNLPAIITLCSGLFVSIITLIYEYSIESAMWILACVMVIFYAIGLLLKFILNKAFEESIVEEDPNSELEETDNK